MWNTIIQKNDSSKTAIQSDFSVEYILELKDIWAFSFSSSHPGQVHYLFIYFCWCLRMTLKKLFYLSNLFAFPLSAL